MTDHKKRLITLGTMVYTILVVIAVFVGSMVYSLVKVDKEDVPVFEPGASPEETMFPSGPPSVPTPLSPPPVN